MECKIFISSTFKDMQNERDLIRNEILPEIENYAMKYGITVNIVDLRWGINTDDCEDSDEASVKILKTCFDEITLCKPFFIGIVGERYGWIPSIDSIKNSIDPSFSNKLNFEEKSVTEYEMDFALNTYSDDEASYIFCLRNSITGNLSLKEEEIYFAKNKEDKARIKKLKEKIKKKCPNSYIDYDVKIENDKFDLSYFKSSLITALKKELDKRFAALEQPQNDIDKEIIFQKAIINQKNSYFSGRKLILNKINEFYQSDDKILGIYGTSGIGKSSIIDHEITSSFNKEDEITLFFLAGVSDNSNFVFNLITSLYYQLSKYLNIDFDNNLFNNNYVQENYKQIVNEFYLLLTDTAKTNKVRIFIDALDQFSISKDDDVLSWLNSYYLNSLTGIDLRILFSYIPFDYINKQIVLKDIKTLELNGIDNDDIINITSSILKKNNKSIPKNALSLFLDKKDENGLCTANPLYLSLLLQEIINFDYVDFKNIDFIKENEKCSDEEAIYRYVYRIIDNAPTSLAGQFDSLVKKLSTKISPEFVNTVLGIISMSRNGVDEALIQGVFAKLNMHFNAADFSYFKKSLRNLIKENDKKIDFSHKIIDNILEDLYFNKLKDVALKINKATVEYLKELNNDNVFKKKEYLFYLKHIEDTNEFYNYYINNLNDETILNSFFTLYNDFLKDSAKQDEFFLNVLKHNKENTLFIVEKLNNSEMAFYVKEKLLLDLLEVNKDFDLDTTIHIYSALVSLNYYHKAVNIAINYIELSIKLLNKYFNQTHKIHPCFLTIYEIYEEILRAKQKISTLRIVIKSYLKKALIANDAAIIDYLKLEYADIIKVSNYKKYKKEFKALDIKNVTSEKYIDHLETFDESLDNYLSLAKNKDYTYFYKHIQVIDKIKELMMFTNNESIYFNLLNKCLQDIDNLLIQKESAELLKQKAFYLDYLAEYHMLKGNISLCIDNYNKSIPLYDLIIKIDDESIIKQRYANAMFNLEKLTKQYHKKSKKLYKEYNKHNKIIISPFLRKIELLFNVATFTSIFLIYFVGSFLISSYPFIFAYISSNFADKAYYGYLLSSGEVFLFIVGAIFMVYVLYYLFAYNKQAPESKYYLRNIWLYLLVSIIMLGVIYYIYEYEFTNGGEQTLFTITNLLIGGYSIFVILYSYNKILLKKNKLQFLKNQTLFKKQNHTSRFINYLISFVGLFILIYITTTKNSWWFYDNISLSCLYLLYIANIASIVILLIENFYGITITKKGK